MKKVYFIALALAWLSFTASAHATKVKAIEEIHAKQLAASCLSKPWNKAALNNLKKNNFEVASSENRESLARQLLNCLASPDPQIRDGVAFEALSYWLRNNKLSTTTQQFMFEQLIKTVTQQVIDENGVYQPFSVLVLAELARADRKSAYLTKIQRTLLVDNAINHLTQIRDYRGFDEAIGWRHDVAHSADLLLQLSLNSRVDKEQLDRILLALASQVSPVAHFYVYGEPKRLALPVAYVFLRKMHSIKEWENWLTAITVPAPFPSWQEMYTSQAGLVKLHNTRAFLQSLYISINGSKNETLISMLPALKKALAAIN